ncbi:WD40-repeat-containing domain protein [Kickxella alabastrina]|uniref:WD40-repeat-containing domain protein n=1 Tax=Kickxella alabastrina TaxID=61397 RepID=UPI0022201E48|nr:WD40-repeat-containing domain protein [Kickxella alabastrina]KAI7831924.1 WD40-repeat-containing domain protein [Kickxella alabastrina]
MSAYRVVSTFEERGIRPPSKESVTVGETDLKFIHLRDSQDTFSSSAKQPIPRSVLKDAVGGDSVVRRQTEQQSSDSESTARPGQSQIGAFNHASHALWLWNAKENASDLINYMQTRWLPGPLASAVFGQVPGTASAARADAMEVEEEEGKRNMLAKSEGPISCIAWHPHRSLVAIAHRASNTIFLYDMGSGTWCPNVLQNAYMQGITSMAWQPNCGYTLAVGCSTGVCLWGIIPSANVQPSANPLSAPSLGSMQFSSWMTLMAFPPLAAQYQYPSRLAHADKTAFHRSSASVSALTFSPSGQWLITGHQSHGHLTVWDVALGTATPLKRSGSSSRSAALQVEISPNGRHLVSTHANGQLRLWETESWTSRVWSDFHGTLAGLPGRQTRGRLASSFLAHATATSDGSEDSERIRHLLLAVYLVNSQALFRAGGDTSALMPLGYIRGPNWGKQHPQEATSSDELSTPPVAKQDKATNKKRVRLGLPIPSWFGFAPNFEPGALLTVAWANGKVTFVPMLFRNSNFSS